MHSFSLNILDHNWAKECEKREVLWLENAMQQTLQALIKAVIVGPWRVVTCDKAQMFCIRRITYHKTFVPEY